MIIFLVLRNCFMKAHLVVPLFVIQVLYRTATVQWGPQSVQNFFFTPVQSFVDPVHVTEDICSFGIVWRTLHNNWSGTERKVHSENKQSMNVRV